MDSMRQITRPRVDLCILLLDVGKDYRRGTGGGSEGKMVVENDEAMLD